MQTKGQRIAKAVINKKSQYTPTGLDIDTLALIDRIKNEPAFREFVINAVNSYETIAHQAKMINEMMNKINHDKIAVNSHEALLRETKTVRDLIIYLGYEHEIGLHKLQDAIRLAQGK